MRTLIICATACGLIVWIANQDKPAQSKPAVPPVTAHTNAGARDTIMDKATRAVATIESHGNPRAHRFEPHVFERLAGEHARTLEEAKRINWRAAMLATSYGQFQILGTNYRRAGYKSVVEMLRADSARQVKGFHTYLKTAGLDRLLHQRRWRAFARAYNGVGYKRNRYDQKLTNLMEG